MNSGYLTEREYCFKIISCMISKDLANCYEAQKPTDKMRGTQRTPRTQHGGCTIMRLKGCVQPSFPVTLGELNTQRVLI
jgi:hypothetical protein